MLHKKPWNMQCNGLKEKQMRRQGSRTGRSCEFVSVYKVCEKRSNHFHLQPEGRCAGARAGLFFLDSIPNEHFSCCASNDYSLLNEGVRSGTVTALGLFF